MSLTVDFTDLSTGDIASWLWEFGDGDTSNTENPSHTYAIGGVYEVRLTVFGVFGGSSSVSELIAVSAISSFVLSGGANGSGVPASSTRYLSVAQPVLYSSEGSARWVTPVAMTLSNFRISVGAQPASGDMVITILKNGSPTTVTVTALAGAASQVYSDLVHTIDLAVGDAIDLALVNAATGATGGVTSWSIQADTAVTNAP